MLQDEKRKQDEDVLAAPKRIATDEVGRNKARKRFDEDDGYTDNMAERDLKVHPTHVNQEQQGDDIYIFTIQIALFLMFASSVLPNSHVRQAHSSSHYETFRASQ